MEMGAKGGAMILKNSDTSIDDERDDDGANGIPMRENEASQSMAADSVDEGKINQAEELLVQDDDSGEGKMDKGELDGQIMTGGDDGIPRVGMVFNSYGEAVTFYKRYAMRVGFGVTIKKSSFTTYGLCRRLVLVCSKEGKAQTKACYHQSRPSMKTNCEAAFIAKLWGDGLLHVVEAKLEHNHELNPSEAHLYRCYKNMSSGATKDLAVRSAGREHLPYVGMEFLNSIEEGQLKLAEGDKEAICQFFARMQTKNPNFFYLLDLDMEGHLRNVFWADSRSRSAYNFYGDVVYFDSTYLRNEYKIPLALFVGSNSHGQLVLLGCGLLTDETPGNYLWLFKAWLTCMLENPPNAIITDQSKALQSVVARVIPEARHRICLSGITRSIPEKLREHTEWKTIHKAMNEVIYNSLKVDEFEEGWRNLTKTYGLEGNEWLNSLYEDRKLWAPVYLKDMFWAGLSTTLYEECVIPFFEGFIYPETSLQNLLENYEMILRTKYELEAKADFDSFHKSPLTVPDSHLGQHMGQQLSEIYTLSMFEKFQHELKATLYCEVSIVKVDGSISTLEVRECAYTEGGNDYKCYEVLYHVDEFQVQCMCGFFQFTGILCRHALRVLIWQQVYQLPSQYILNRWRKDFKLLHALDRFSKDAYDNKQVEQYDSLALRCLHLVEVGMVSDEKYQLALKLIREVERSLLDDNIFQDLHSRLVSSVTRLTGNEENHSTSQVGIVDGDKTPSSVPSKRRGRPPKKRKESDVEPVNDSSSKKDSLRAPADGHQSNLFQSSSTATHFGTHDRTQGVIDIMEEVNQNDLAFSSHYGLQSNHQHHLGNQLQSGATLQSPFGQQTLGNQSRMQWICQQMLQEEQTPFGRRTG
ncbi:protein FAR1-RELATED SEQUENCE 6 [Canna indica]|uniref:Protein FAR1-RELATED SEQUENCE n=1 Tax=Canna indica TaxID=4628 RepID=A0AAQ3KXY2_9LILI|nr:protein FAR1-RELATED SEQUENCE 6 [Canna indica]